MAAAAYRWSRRHAPSWRDQGASRAVCWCVSYAPITSLQTSRSLRASLQQGQTTTVPVYSRVALAPRSRSTTTNNSGGGGGHGGGGGGGGGGGTTTTTLGAAAFRLRFAASGVRLLAACTTDYCQCSD
eukprot:COSAG02_NODE_809_length_16922_cov_11.295013_8_plen_128_part_00